MYAALCILTKASFCFISHLILKHACGSRQITLLQGVGSGTKLSLDLTPASEPSKASPFDLGSGLHTKTTANRQPVSPAYKTGIDINFLRTHDL